VSQATPFLVGIAGGSGSGKTSFLRDLLLHFPAQKIALVSQDNYYHPKELQQKDENGVINFDLPTSINREYFYNDMMKLMRGEPIELMEYNFNNPNVAPKKIIVQPAPVIIMEGLFVFHYDEIRTKLNYKVFIDVHHEERLQRRIKRDGAERGYPEHEVIYQWHHHVRPSEEEYLYPYLPECDLIVDNTVHYREGLQTLAGTIQQFLAQ
jgi:uridine kinase